MPKQNKQTLKSCAGALAILLFLILLTLAPFAGYTHDGAQGNVAARMSAMKMMGKAVKSLALMFRKSEPFDRAAVKFNALAIGSHGGTALLELFPKGSRSEVSEAKPEIWQDWNSFAEEAMRLSESAADLAKAMDDGKSKSESRKIFESLTRSCSACHKAFRQKQ